MAINQIIRNLKNKLLGTTSLYAKLNNARIRKQQQSRLSRRGTKVGAILDEFSFNCLNPEWNLRRLWPIFWRWQLSGLDFIFIESAWQGNHGLWRYSCSHFEKSRQGRWLATLLARAKKENIPTVFWAKEDPVFFDRFIAVAKQFDYIFTTDENCIEKYKQAMGHDRVYALPFAAQPLINNPIGRRRPRLPSFCFAGAWQSGSLEERIKELETLLDAARESGDLVVYDRYASTEKLRFPKKYQAVTRRKISHRELCQEYKHHRAFINVNTVTNSPTMFARRTFEVLGSATPVVSGRSLGIERMLGDVVRQPQGAEEIRSVLAQYRDDPFLADRDGLRGLRKVLNDHTYRQRAAFVEECLQLSQRNLEVASATVITVSNRPDCAESVIANFERQARSNLQFLYVTNSKSFDQKQLQERVRRASVPIELVECPEDWSLGQCLNHAIDRADGDYIAKMDDDDFYGEFYLADILDSFKYSGADIAGKTAYFVYSAKSDQTYLRFPKKSDQFVSYVCGATLTMRRDSLRSIRFSDRNRGEDTDFQSQCRKAGIVFYSTDPYNYQCIRQADAGAHTWQISEAEIEEDSQLVGQGPMRDKIMF